MDLNRAQRKSFRRHTLAAVLLCASAAMSVKGETPTDSDPWQAFRVSPPVETSGVSGKSIPQVPRRLPPAIRQANSADPVGRRVTELYGPVSQAASAVASKPLGQVSFSRLFTGKHVTISQVTDPTSQRAVSDSSPKPRRYSTISTQSNQMAPLPRITHRTVDTSRLMEGARESLKTAQLELANHSYFSSRKSALDALRTIVGVNDMASGTTWHSQQLRRGLQAILEVEDFNGKFGAVDREALQRMVCSHETSVLKNADTSQLTAIEATEYYLQEARICFFDAAANRPEAGQALMFMARSEKEKARTSRHAASVALAMQQVASELLPNDAQAFRELAKSQLHQGLVNEARQSLDHAIAIEPNLEAFELMTQVAAKLGDSVLQQWSVAAARQSAPKPNPVSVRVISPAEFAATSTNVGRRSAGPVTHVNPQKRTLPAQMPQNQPPTYITSNSPIVPASDRAWNLFKR